MNTKTAFTNDELLALLNKRYTLKQLTEALKSTEKAIRNRLKTLGLSTKDFKLDETVFNTIDTEEKAYWLGFWFADGCINKNKSIELGLKYSDIGHLYKFCDFIKSDYSKVKVRKTMLNGKQFLSCRWATKRLALYSALINKGCINRKSLILKFPDLAIFKSKELVYHFIRGYIDGDGCLGIKTHKYKEPTLTLQVVGTFEFLSQMCSILHIDSNKLFHKDKKHPNSNTYSIFLTSDNALKTANLLYKNATIYLDRKMKIYKFAVSQSNL